MHTSPPDSLPHTDLDRLTINTIRFLAVDAVQQAKSGHPGLPMGAAAMAYTLWTRHLKHNPSNPRWVDRDRFVLSAGHGSMLLYALLHLTGYPLRLDDLKQFRQWGSKTPGHPEYHETEGVETTTGPLGQGFANGVGMAMAERSLSAHFNRPGFPVVDHFTYGIVSDGDLMEGISHEAASFAGHHRLGKLIYLYDDNDISIDGSTDITFTEDVGQRFEAYGWHVQHVSDGNELAAVDAALHAARDATDRPSLIVVRTHIGYGSPNKQDTADVHGSPLGPEEVILTKKNLDWPVTPAFYVPEPVHALARESRESGAAHEAAWTDLFAQYRAAYPDLAERFERWQRGEAEEDWAAHLPSFDPEKKVATRAASGTVMNAIAAKVGNLFGGSGDLTGSTKTYLKGLGDFQPETPEGLNVFFGVREHAMASICNGIALHGGLRPFCATFLVFSDYLRPALRLSALMRLPVIYVFTHDSIGLGEDGPTHQPVEHYLALRAIPNLTFIRPADGRETAEAWRVALENTTGPTALALSRQGLPQLDRSTAGDDDGVGRGAYILSDDEGRPELILMASGSEVQLITGAADVLREEGVRVRVVSMPSWERFDAQPDAYRNAVLPADVTRRLAVEAGVSLGWGRYVGSAGRIIGLDHFGASAPASVLFTQFGFTVDRVVEEARALLG